MEKINHAKEEKNYYSIRKRTTIKERTIITITIRIIRISYCKLE